MSVTFDIQFRTPPLPVRRSAMLRKEQTETAIEALTARPGEWAAIWSNLPSGSAHYYAKKLKDAGMDVTTRKNGSDNTRVVWARCPEA